MTSNRHDGRQESIWNSFEIDTRQGERTGFDPTIPRSLSVDGVGLRGGTRTERSRNLRGIEPIESDGTTVVFVKGRVENTTTRSPSTDMGRGSAPILCPILHFPITLFLRILEIVN